MSKNFNKFKSYYMNGLWTRHMLHNVVGKKFGITIDEYKEITGYEY